MTELYPEGKRLWLSVCEVRGGDLADAAEMEWEQWEEGFLTRGEWQHVAESFTAGMAVPACTNSNEPGQPGSAYGVKADADAIDKLAHLVGWVALKHPEMELLKPAQEAMATLRAAGVKGTRSAVNVGHASGTFIIVPDAGVPPSDGGDR